MHSLLSPKLSVTLFIKWPSFLNVKYNRLMNILDRRSFPYYHKNMNEWSFTKTDDR